MASAVVGAVQIGLTAASGYAKYEATKMKIDETIDDYQQQVDQYKAEKADAVREATASMGAQGAANQYNAGLAAQKAALSNGEAKAKMGFSGVRGDSPLMAIAQTERMNREAVGETVRQGSAELYSMGGRFTTLTANYNRAMQLSTDKMNYLRQNRNKMQWAAALGGAVDVAGTVANVGQRQGWF